MTKENDEQFVETYDEDGNLVTFELIDIVEVDDIEYALLLPVDEKATEAEESEILIMRLKRNGEEYEFEELESDEEFDKVAEYVQQIEDEIED